MCSLPYFGVATGNVFIRCRLQLVPNCRINFIQLHETPGVEGIESAMDSAHPE
jgi:hypothetical protein